MCCLELSYDYLIVKYKNVFFLTCGLLQRLHLNWKNVLNLGPKTLIKTNSSKQVRKEALINFWQTKDI